MLINSILPPARATMRQPPVRFDAQIVGRTRLAELFLLGTLMGRVGFLSFFMVRHTDGTVGAAQAAAFTGIVLCPYVNILSRRPPF